MSVAREQVYQALFALVQPLGVVNSTGIQLFQTVSREVVEVSTIDPGLQPVLLMDEVTEKFGDDGEGLVPDIWTVVFHIGVTSTKGTPGNQILNPLIDAVVAALQPLPGIEKQTLGNLVEHVQVKGDAVKVHGNNSKKADARQATYYLPIEIVLPQT
jgi:hypothetical protein